MHIVIKAIKVLHNVEESTTCHEHIWQSGRSEVAAVYGEPIHQLLDPTR